MGNHPATPSCYQEVWKMLSHTFVGECGIGQKDQDGVQVLRG
jgi:hypothetical protein